VRWAEAPEPIHSHHPNDSWNWIFYYLFSRRVSARPTADFVETGGHAIDRSYPSFLSNGGTTPGVGRAEVCGIWWGTHDRDGELHVAGPKLDAVSFDPPKISDATLRQLILVSPHMVSYFNDFQGTDRTRNVSCRVME
jgi:hypothetical protein